MGTRLVDRHHRVDLLTGQPKGFWSCDDVDGISVRYVRTPLPQQLARRGWTTQTAFAGIAAAGAALSSADVIVSYLYADAYGASLSRRLPGRQRRPLVLKLTGSVPRAWLEQRGERVERAFLRRALDAADEVWVNSQYVVDAMADWGRPMSVVPAGLDDRAFRPCAERAERPTVLCTAAPEDPRKRLVDLLGAWPAVRSELPDARLVLAGRAEPQTRERLLALLPEADRPSVSFVGLLSGEHLPRAYSSAWAVVAPAVHEALGLATLEALACGTPVAGARSGATPELLSQPGTGALFAPADPASLADAVLEVVALSHADGTRAACRTAALRYAWPGIVDDVERRLQALLP
jgi:glycosyltransferase involved in cell wall biosynthesis